MNDREFLLWLHTRLHKVYGEDKRTDFVLKLEAIANATPSEQYTPNVIPREKQQ